ncbi:MAG: CHASE4 domain-containing protein [Desulforhopalus sp.]
MYSLIKMIPGRIFLGLLLLVAIYSIANYAVIRWIVTPNHLRVEGKLAQMDMERLVEALLREKETLATTVHDWAAWDDTKTFVHDRNREYIASNLSDTTLFDSEINLLYIFRLDGSLVWSRLLDLETEEPMVLTELPANGLQSNHPLVHHSGVNSSTAGLKKTVRGPMLIASHPIVSSENQGPIVGTLVFGRLLTERLMTKLRQQTKVSGRLIGLDDQQLLAELPSDVSSLGPATPVVYHYDTDRIAVYSLLVDYQGKPEWLLEVYGDRLLTSHSRKILRYVLLSNIVIGTVTLICFLFFYRRQIRTFTSTFRGLIDQSLPKNLKERRKNPALRSFSADEFSRLSDDLRSMITSFEQTKEHQKNIISQQSASRRELNTLLVNEIKARLKIEEDLHKIQEDLEQQVDRRTKELRQINTALQDEIEVRRKSEIELKKHRQRLRALSSELMEMEDKERRQLATELHDQIGQSLSVVKMYLDILVFSESDASGREKLQQIAGIVDQTVQDVRTLTFELSPPVLYELGLDAALDWLAEEFDEKYSLAIKIECDVICKGVTSAFLALIFRTIRELLINVVRHARAESAEVKVNCVGKDLRLTVSDNGIGMNNADYGGEESGSGGFGLFSIRERILNIGGTFVIESEENEGTAITLIVPIQEDCFEGAG